MSPNDADGMANSVDPDQQSDLGLHCLPRHICPKRPIITVSFFYIIGVIIGSRLSIQL